MNVELRDGPLEEPVDPAAFDPSLRRSVTADAQREPLDVLDELAFVLHEQGYCGEVCVCVDDARALLPTVQRLIADAEKRAAAAALRDAAEARWEYDGPTSVWLRALADALDPK